MAAGTGATPRIDCPADAVFHRGRGGLGGGRIREAQHRIDHDVGVRGLPRRGESVDETVVLGLLRHRVRGELGERGGGVQHVVGAQVGLDQIGVGIPRPDHVIGQPLRIHHRPGPRITGGAQREAAAPWGTGRRPAVRG
jgi:hypothetical protein